MDHFFKYKKCLVTGGAGFIGSHLSKKLLKLKSKVTIIDDLSHGKLENVPVDFPPQSLMTKNVLELTKKEISKFDIIFHLAAEATTKESSLGWNDPNYDLNRNLLPTLHILNLIKDLKNQPILFYASTAAVYGNSTPIPIKESNTLNPISPYGISKLSGEFYCMAYNKIHNIDIKIGRIFNTYGPNQSRYVHFDLMTKIYNDPKNFTILGDGNQIRDYLYVSDTTDAILKITSLGENCQPYNISKSAPTSIKNLVKILYNVIQKEDLQNLNFLHTSWKGDIDIIYGDNTKLQQLGFKPKVNLEEGIKKLFNWYLSVHGK